MLILTIEAPCPCGAGSPSPPVGLAAQLPPRETEAQSREVGSDLPFTSIRGDQESAGGTCRFPSKVAELGLEHSSPGCQAGLRPRPRAAPWLASVLPVAGKRLLMTPWQGDRKHFPTTAGDLLPASPSHPYPPWPWWRH